MSDIAAEPYFVVVAKPQREQFAATNLEREGFDVYLPKYLPAASGRPGRPMVATPRPLFPPYLFARIAPSVERWQAVFSARGVRGILRGAGEDFLPVSDEVIDAIRAQEVAGLVKLMPKAPFQPGERVKAQGSAFEAIFEELDDEKRAWVLIELCGRKLRQRVPLARLERA